MNPSAGVLRNGARGGPVHKSSPAFQGVRCGHPRKTPEGRFVNCLRGLNTVLIRLPLVCDAIRSYQLVDFCGKGVHILCGLKTRNYIAAAVCDKFCEVPFYLGIILVVLVRFLAHLIHSKSL